MIRNTAIAFVLTLSVVSAASARIWVDRSGQFRVDAELVAIRNGKAYLERTNGTVTAVPLDKLSIDDLKFLASSDEYKEVVAPFLPATDQPNSPDADPTVKQVQPSVEVRDQHRYGQVRRFDSKSWGYEGICFSPDGTFLAALSSKGIVIFDVNNEKSTLFEIDRRESGRSSQLTFSPDGNLLLAGTSEGLVLIWNFDTDGKLSPYKRFRIHNSDVTSISVTPDNKYAVSLEQDDILRSWKVETGEQITAYDGFDWARYGATFITPRGGQALATDGNLVVLIELPECKPLQAMPLSRGVGQSVAISPDGTHIAVNDTYDMKVWQTQTGHQLPIFDGDEIHWSAAFSPNGRLLATGSSAQVSIWSLDSSKAVHTFKTGPSGYVKKVAFSPDGMHVACIGGPIGQTIEVFRLPVALRGDAASK